MQHCYFVGEEMNDVAALDLTARKRIRLDSQRISYTQPTWLFLVPRDDIAFYLEDIIDL